jgi:glycosyltransferase involved in cell wall biosynthesis
MYRKSDVLLLPSYNEGFPYVVIEAMCAGLPIIATSVGALEALVLDGVTGFKVRPKDVDSIVTAIRKVSHNRTLLNEMSENCHRYFKENLSKSAGERYYAELLSENHAANA